MLHIKREDEVLILAGRDRGKKGKVLRMVGGGKRAVVENINMFKRHTRPNPQKNIQGGVVEREASVQLSNLMVICRECSKPTRVSYTRLSDGKKVRECKKCGGTLDK
ncbi:MAG: 50S ribosomal protein L24 [Acidobacteriota bacterium]